MSLVERFRCSHIFVSAAFSSMESLSYLELDHNNLSELDPSPFMRTPNSSHSLSISILFNPIRCSCALIDNYNQVVQSKPNLENLWVSCLYSYMSHNANIEAGLHNATLSASTQNQVPKHLLLQEFGEKHCAHKSVLKVSSFLVRDFNQAINSVLYKTY